MPDITREHHMHVACANGNSIFQYTATVSMLHNWLESCGAETDSELSSADMSGVPASIKWGSCIVPSGPTGSPVGMSEMISGSPDLQSPHHAVTLFLSKR